LEDYTRKCVQTLETVTSREVKGFENLGTGWVSGLNTEGIVMGLVYEQQQSSEIEHNYDAG